MKSNTKEISIALSPEILKKLEKGNYNKNKLVNQLLKEYLDKNKK